MATIDERDLVEAVMASRDEVAPDIDAELLTGILEAEVAAAGDAEQALRAIDVAVSAAMERGAGRHPELAAGDGAEGDG